MLSDHIIPPDQDASVEGVWRDYLEKGDYEKENRQRRFFRWLPGEQRCKFCKVPFSGVFAPFTRALYAKRPSKQNPNFCNVCELFAEEHQGGAEVEISMLFVEVRGSTALAEKMSAGEFDSLIDRFYRTVTRTLIHEDALIDKLSGDKVTAIFAPGFVGRDHARRAVVAGLGLLTLTGHAEMLGPWITIGVGIHTGVGLVGSFGDSKGIVDITAVGDMPNTASLLASEAKTGEMVVSAAAVKDAGMDTSQLLHRSFELKGKTERVHAWVFPSSRRNFQFP